MAITTTNGKLAVMEWDNYSEPGLPISPSTLGQNDQQQLLWDFPEILWGAQVVIAFVLDLNTRLQVYLQTAGGTGDLSSMLASHIAVNNPATMNKPVFDLIDDATP